MMDYYLNHSNCVNRLVDEYYKHGSIIVAYDYDNTVFDYHGESHNYFMIKDLLKRLEPYSKLIVFTASNESRYPEIQKYLLDNKIPYDGINRDVLSGFGRKIYYNILLDDRAGLYSAYLILRDFLNLIEKGEKNENKFKPDANG